VAGDPALAISADFVGISERAVQRHRNGHLPALLVQAQDAQEVARADRLLADLRDLHERTLAILAQAEAAADHATALRAITEARRNVELLAKLLGLFRDGLNVNIVATDVRYEILSASGDLIEEGGAQ